MSASAIGMLLWMGGVGLVCYQFLKLFKTEYGQYVDRYIESAQTTLSATDVFMAPEALLRISALCAAAGVLAGVFAGLGGSLLVMILFAVVLGIAGFNAPKGLLKILAWQRLNKFETQLADAIELLSKSMRAGLSPAAAFGVGARELPKPASQEFAIVVRDTQNNRPLNEAVKRLADRMKLEDTRLLAIVMDLGMREGGNMTEALDAVASTVRNRFNVRRKVKAATASARAQVAVVASMPFVMLGVFTLVNPEMMEPLWTTHIGLILVGVVCFLEFVGISVMIKIAKKVEY